MVTAVLVSLALVLAAPFIGEFRRWIANTLPDQYIWIVNGTVGSALLIVMVSAFRRVAGAKGPAASRRRFGILGVALLIAVVFTRLTGSPVPAVAAVEHFHFVQYGFVTWLFYRAWRARGDVASFVLPAAAAFTFGIAEEWWQWFLPARVGELNDVLLNSVAILCGLMVSWALAPVESGGASRVRNPIRDSIVGVTVASVALSAFIWTVHVGYVIDDSEIGQFRSRYSGETLQALSAERSARWAVDPPLIRRTRTREDQYRSEGETHVRARNEAWEQGDVATAWGENLILEKYFAAVLDTPSHISQTGHRWHKDHRADAERRFAMLGTPPRFISTAAVDTKWGRGSRKVTK